MKILLVPLILLSTLSLAEQPKAEMVVVTWVRAHVPFKIQTVSFPTMRACYDAEQRILHKMDIQNEARVADGKEEIGFTLMCREVKDRG